MDYTFPSPDLLATIGELFLLWILLIAQDRFLLIVELEAPQYMMLVGATQYNTGHTNLVKQWPLSRLAMGEVGADLSMLSALMYSPSLYCLQAAWENSVVC